MRDRLSAATLAATHRKRILRPGPKALALFGFYLLITPVSGSAEEAGRADGRPSPAQRTAETERLRIDAALLDGDRIVIGTVEDIKGGQIQVRTGESLQPRYLAQAVAESKGEVLRKGDLVRLVFNEQQVLVDFHPLGRREGRHRVVRGAVAEQMKVGQERVIVRSGAGQEETYAVRPLIRSKVAAMPIGASAVFLLDEADQVIDVTFGSADALELAAQAFGHMSMAKSSHTRIDGTLIAAPANDRVTVKTAGGTELSYPVRPMAAEQLSRMKTGESVTLLLDDSRHVADVAQPNSSVKR